MRGYRIACDLYSVIQVEMLIRSEGHPNIVRYFDKEESSDFIFLALELCDATLSSVLHKVDRQYFPHGPPARIPVPSSATRHFIYGIVDGIAHLHRHKILHRDIKPGNILLLRQKGEGKSNERTLPYDQIWDSWMPKVSDMGLGKVIQRSSSVSHVSAFSTNFQKAVKSRRGGEEEEKMVPREFAENAFQALDSTSDAAVGTRGWQAPEILRRMIRDTGSECEGSGSGGGESPVFRAQPFPGSAASSYYYGGRATLRELISFALKELRVAADGEGEGAKEGDEEEKNDSDPDLTIRKDSSHVPSLSEISEDQSDSFSDLPRTSRKSRAPDIWSLGCLIYSVLVPNRHPYGDSFFREANVLRNSFSLTPLSSAPDAEDLVRRMIDGKHSCCKFELGGMIVRIWLR